MAYRLALDFMAKQREIAMTERRRPGGWRLTVALLPVIARPVSQTRRGKSFSLAEFRLGATRMHLPVNGTAKDGAGTWAGMRAGI